MTAISPDIQDKFDKLYNPSSIAIVGISRRPISLGRMLLNNLIDYGYDASKIYLVNPGADEIGGIKCYPSLNKIPGQVDMVVSLVSRDFVKLLMVEAGEKNVNSMIIITSGFREVGEDGALLEEKIGYIAKQNNITVIGPNSMGILNGQANLHVTFSPIAPKPGNLAFLSQSGALGAVMMSYANVTNMGFSKFISLGNKMDVDEFDAIQYLVGDESTNVIMLYLESFSQPREFYKYCRTITKDKPVIAVKSGRTDRGAKAAVSHTGALASADVIIDAAMTSSGIIRADSMQEMFDTAHALNKLKNVLPRGRRVAVISNAGGPGTIATDAVIKAGFIVDDFTGKTKAALDEFLPVEASTTNPVDVLPSSGPTGYAKSIEIMVQDPNIDIILVVFLPPVIVGIDKMLRGVNEVARLSSKPIIGCFLNGDCNLIKYDYLSFPVFEYSETAVQVMQNLLKYNEFKNAEVNYIKFETSIDEELQRRIIEASEQNSLLEQDDTISLLSDYGFKYPKTLIIDSKDQLNDFLDGYELGKQSVVIKMACKTISHKSDAGGVKLNLASLEEIDVAINMIYSIYDDRNVPMDDRKIMIQEFINLKNGVEVALGIKRDQQFGSAVMIALGGIYIEVLKDSEFRMVPITDREASDMVNSLKGKKILEGYRLPFEIDLELYKDQILRLSQMAADYPIIEELDINPLFVNDNGAYVLDARISVNKI